MESLQRKAAKATWCLSECAGGDAAPRVITLATFPFVIGRLPASSLCLSAPNISKQHAEIVLRSGRLSVRDLGSTNGTFVNEERIQNLTPLHEGDLLQLATEVFRVQRHEPDAHLRTVAQGSFLLVESLCQFDRLMSQQAVVPHFQPIVMLAGRQVVGYELLARSSLAGLENPAAMFAAAERLNQEVALSIMLRREGVRAAQQLAGRPMLYVNTHPKELGTRELLESLAEIRSQAPHQPITIEVHEAAVADERALLELRQAARGWEMQLAYDDFGAGQSRIDELARVAPDCVKFDMRLIRDLHQASAERRLVTARLVELVRDLGITPLAEGVENEAEAIACEELGFDLAQGYLFGRPAPVTACTSAPPVSNVRDTGREFGLAASGATS
jgi:EAL domain-containing protein (putative c-di-GMP-specific phosphodiesterase class I)